VPKGLHKPAHRTIIVQICSLKSGAFRKSSCEAFAFGVLLSLSGGFYLALAVNRLTALLALATLLSYLLVYTPLKRKTPLCTLYGPVTR